MMICATRNSAGENALLARWAEVAGRRGDAPAVFGVDGAVLRTFSGIEEEVAAIGRRLEFLEPGSVLGIQLGNVPEWPAVLLAAFRRGLLPLPLGMHLGRAERAEALQVCRAAALVEVGKEGLALSPLDRGPLGAEGIEFLKLTSGTTAAPRAICFRVAQIVADCDNICDTMGIGPGDINYGVIPISHSYGFSNLLTPLLCRGVPLVAAEDRLPRAILAGIGRSGSTVFPGMPVFYQALAALDEPPPPRLRLCISAGAPLSRCAGEAFTKRFGLKIHTFYGASECGGIGYDRSDAAEYEEGFAGAAMENVVIEPLVGEGVSRIRVRSAAVGEGYFPERDEEALGSGGFIPGDLVTVTPGGLHLSGRISDVINVAGRKLNPMEVESRMADYPGVRQVIVFGVVSSLRNEEAVACVAADAGLRQEDLLRYCRSVLSGWQVPKDIWLVPEIPVNDRGKISRRELARNYADLRGAR